MKIAIKKLIVNSETKTDEFVTLKTVTGIRGLLRVERDMRQRTGRGLTYVWALLTDDFGCEVMFHFNDSSHCMVKFGSLRAAYDFVKARKSWNLVETKQTATGFVFDIPSPIK